jgi:hypothetical protein
MVAMSVSEWLAVVEVVSLTQCLPKEIRARPRLSDNYILFVNPRLQDAIRGIPKTIRLTPTGDPPQFAPNDAPALPPWLVVTRHVAQG